VPRVLTAGAGRRRVFGVLGEVSTRKGFPHPAVFPLKPKEGSDAERGIFFAVTDREALGTSASVAWALPHHDYRQDKADSVT
jgi:hypothetical protein